MNRLHKETSPYLLQHAHNPVDWFPWSDEAWERARKENKLVLVSIGYSACHWCHVMEREVFEKRQAAELMNSSFISIKVDREERPDVDQVYMTALQLMTGQGGWPLNCFCLPDGRPVFGGTYFPMERWMDVLQQLLSLHQNEPARLRGYADQLKEGVIQFSNPVKAATGEAIDAESIHAIVSRWSQYWDMEKGGARKAPKFPMPSNHEFLLHYGLLFSHQSSLDYVRLTLDKMASGGIYDQIGGGFARYSVDDMWKVPHFEKMLYDNAQLVTLYSEAFRAFGTEEYKEVIHQTLHFISRELTSPEGLFYAALDADSEGVEGKYYVWQEQEIDETLGALAGIAKRYFRVGQEGHWEHGVNILLRTAQDDSFAVSEGMTPDDWQTRKRLIYQTLLHKRSDRIRPGLDDKIITSWNGMMIRALAEAWAATGDHGYLSSATKAARAVLRFMTHDNGLFRQYTKGKASIPAFLDDYAFMAEALVILHSCTGEEEWLHESHRLMLIVLDRFSDEHTGLFWYTPDDGEILFTRQMDLADNVIPSANSSLCQTLFLLGHFLERPDYVERSRRMIAVVLSGADFGASWSNWLKAALWHAVPYHEVVICGPEAPTHSKSWFSQFIPNTLFAASTVDRSLPLFKGRYSDKTAVYVCTGSSCHAPVFNMDDAIRLLS